MLVLASCGGGSGSSSSAGGILDDLSSDVSMLSVLDVSDMAGHYDVGAGDLQGLSDLEPLRDDEGEYDPVTLASYTVIGHVPPMAQPFITAYHELDLSQMKTVVSIQNPAVVLVATDQDEEDLASLFLDGGFDPAGDGRYLHPDSGVRGGSAGYPAVELSDGWLRAGPSFDDIDAVIGGSGPAEAVEELFEATDDHWAVALSAYDDDSDGCGDGWAVARAEDGDEVVVIGHEGEVALDDVVEEGFDVGSPEADDDVTRLSLEDQRTPFPVDDPTTLFWEWPAPTC